MFPNKIGLKLYGFLELIILVNFFQEFYIRHKDGSPISSEAERQRVIQCLEAAVERRASEVCIKLDYIEIDWTF